MLTNILDRIRGHAPQVSPMPVFRVAGMDLSPLEQIRNLVLAVGLKKMLTAKHFSICDLETLITAARIIPDGDTMRLLRVLHCVDYADMPVELRKELVRIVAAMFHDTPDPRSTP